MPSTDIIILGAGSQIAPFLSQRLGAGGYGGVLLSRRPPPSTPPFHAAFAWRHWDATAPDWDAPEGALLFSTLPLWLLPPLLEGALGGVRQVVAFGSTSRYSKSESPDPAEAALARRLEASETALAAACERRGIPWTVLRPTLVYGSGRDKNVRLVATFVRRFGFFPVAAPARGLRQPVHADDLAAAAEACIDNPAAFGRGFDLAGGETLAYREMVARIAAAQGRTPRVVPLPAWLLQAALHLANTLRRSEYSPALFTRMNRDLIFDDSAARAALGYRPRPFTP